jgi:nucleotide-binding universal stress UspA family protein
MPGLTVLVPLDGSSFSRQILPSLRKLLRADEYTVTLLRVTAEPEGLTSPPRPVIVNYHTILSTYETAGDAIRGRYPIYATQVAANVEAALRNELQADVYYLQAAGFEVNTAIRFGDPADAIVDYIAANDVDLVALATHGRSGVSRLVLGSVAEQVLRRIDLPVLMVRPTASDDLARRN